jgi:hypothetical protein
MQVFTCSTRPRTSPSKCSHRYDPLPTTSLTYTTSDEMLSVLFKHAEK